MWGVGWRVRFGYIAGNLAGRCMGILGVDFGYVLGNLAGRLLHGYILVTFWVTWRVGYCMGTFWLRFG
jgi:hypothetical protein